MKKFIICFALIVTLLFSFSNFYAVDIINDTRNNIVNIYDEISDSINDNNNNSNPNTNTDNFNNNDNIMVDNVFDGVSVAITVLSVITLAGVIFFHLIPKK